ncbi:MAG: GntR family transcriptional regulator [Lachnospira sp.]|nr:GntR family transcriptional regulator [Lachnospira sp.]
MEWKFNSEAPIYLQIMEQIKAQIATGVLKPGQKIAAVREIALEAGVNPNTVQKALSELEREGFLYSERTAGRFVSDNKEKAENVQSELCKQYMDAFTENMGKLGYSPKEAAKKYSEYVE